MAIHVMRGAGLSTAMASNPNPADEQSDVFRDSDLNWTKGVFAAAHDVYVGESFADVNTATVATLPGLDVNSFDPGRLDYGKTYFWRIDEVNGAPDYTVFKGDVWSFEVEPFSIHIANITVQASSAHDETMVPAKTIDGSGLDEQDQHSIEPTTMWLSGMIYYHRTDLKGQSFK